MFVLEIGKTVKGQNSVKMIDSVEAEREREASRKENAHAKKCQDYYFLSNYLSTICQTNLQKKKSCRPAGTYHISLHSKWTTGLQKHK